MNSQYMFITTHQGSRGLSTQMEIYSLYRIVDFMIKEAEGGYGPQIRFVDLAEGFGQAKILSKITKEEFNKVFADQGLTPKAVSKYFCKDIYSEYGEQKEKDLIKALPKRGMVIGGFYLNRAGLKYCYLGKVSVKVSKSGIKEAGFRGYMQGEGFLHVYFSPSDPEGTYRSLRSMLLIPEHQVQASPRTTYPQKESINFVEMLKSGSRKYYNKASTPDLLMTRHITIESGDLKVEIEFLDFKERDE